MGSHSRSLIGSMAMVFLGTHAVLPANLVFNGSLENPVVPSGAGYISAIPSGWLPLEGGNTTDIRLQGSGGSTASAGSQYVDLIGGAGIIFPSGIRQVIHLAGGFSYHFSFDYNGGRYDDGSPTTDAILDYSLGNLVLGSIDVDELNVFAANGPVTPWQTFSTNVTVPATGDYELRLQTRAGAFASPFVDNVSVTFIEIPEVTTIDFDDVPTGDAGFMRAPADQYRSLGVMFSAPIPVYDLCRFEPPWWCSAFQTAGGTTPNAMILAPFGLGSTLSIDITFAIPGIESRATTDHVVALFGDGNVGTSLGTLEAFDIHGTLLGSDTVTTTPGRNHYPLAIRVPGIAHVRLTGDADGEAIDNITFGPLTDDRRPRLNIRVSEVEISWQSQITKSYTVRYKSQLTTNLWDVLEVTNCDGSTRRLECLPGDGNVMRVYDRIPVGQTQKFYDLVVTNCAPR